MFSFFSDRNYIETVLLWFAISVYRACTLDQVRFFVISAEYEQCDKLTHFLQIN